MKIVLNKCYGMLDLSQEALVKFAELENIKLYFYTYDNETEGYIRKDAYSKYCRVYTTIKNLGEFCEYIPKDALFPIDDIDRTNPNLIQVIEEMGTAKAGATWSYPVIEIIPAGTRFLIKEENGYETIITPEDLEWKIAD